MSLGHCLHSEIDWLVNWFWMSTLFDGRLVLFLFLLAPRFSWTLIVTIVWSEETSTNELSQPDIALRNFLIQRPQNVPKRSCLIISRMSWYDIPRTSKSDVLGMSWINLPWTCFGRRSQDVLERTFRTS